MNNNKTIVPGMESPFVDQPRPEGQPQNSYQGTIFPGMPSANAQVASATPVHKPIKGFMYSVSRTPNGEFWPLYLGSNTIGRSMNSTVKLEEGTISDVHATIVVREMHNPDSMLVFLQDTQSTCGTMLNNQSLGFSPVECHNGDIIKIGEHYEFVLILIDVKAIGLAPCPEFINVKPVVSNFVPEPQVFAHGGIVSDNVSPSNTQNMGINGNSTMVIDYNKLK